MDTALLIFFNKTLANPFLDVIMIGFTTGANLILPGIGIIFLIKKQRRIGLAILTALAIAFVAAICLQLFGARPRPEAFRLVWPRPDFPSYPSSHTATAFAVATVLMFSFRRLRWQILSFAGAALISLSRLYLGAHYFSDIVGGAVLGASIGAASYGFIVSGSSGSLQWRWLLWPQLAIVVILTQMSYLNLPAKGSAPRVFVKEWKRKNVEIRFEADPRAGKAAPGDFRFRFRPVDDVMHFLFFGAVAFWLNIWLKGRKMRLVKFRVPIAVALPFVFAIVEEGLQFFSPYRTLSISDLIFDLAGMVFFCWLSYKLLRRWEEMPYREPKEKYLESVNS